MGPNALDLGLDSRHAGLDFGFGLDLTWYLLLLTWDLLILMWLLDLVCVRFDLGLVYLNFGFDLGFVGL